MVKRVKPIKGIKSFLTETWEDNDVNKLHIKFIWMCLHDLTRPSIAANTRSENEILQNNFSSKSGTSQCMLFHCKYTAQVTNGCAMQLCFPSTCNLRGSKGGPPQGERAVTQLDTFLDLRLWNATLRSWGDLSVTLNQLFELVSTVLISYTFYGAVSLSTHCVPELLIAKTGCLATKKPLTKVLTGYQTSQVSHP